MQRRGSQARRLLAFVLPAAWAVTMALSSVEALEERIEDLQASVEVAQIFGVSLSNPTLTFHQSSPGKTEVLGENGFFHEVICRSNTGRPWHLNAQLLSLKHTSMSATLPPSALKWRTVDVLGGANPEQSRGAFMELSTQPAVIYMSQGDDQRGRLVTIRLQYSLTCPATAPAGAYIGQIVFTMTEGL